METQFVDRILKCADCSGEFIFTAGEQLFFNDKQFKNDPKRCKPCKSRRSGLAAVANGTGLPAAGLARTETRTECSDCGVQTTVPFKPTQGRPVLCRQCFQSKGKALPLAAQVLPTPAATAYALTGLSTNSLGETLSPEAAMLAAASMAGASAESSVASAADLASILNAETTEAPSNQPQVEAGVLAAEAERHTPQLLAAELSTESAEA